MPRCPRNYNKSHFFHIMTQGINREYIFNKPEDIKYYIKFMYILQKEHAIKIIVYCIMNNHAHILIETEHIDHLSKYMQRLNTRYAKYYNKKYNRIGYVFRDRYKSQAIYSDDQLYNCMNYIFNNPVKAGICANAEDYPFSNYKKINCTVSDDYIFIDTEEENKDFCKNKVNDFLQNNNISLEDLKNDIIKLKQLTCLLKNKYHISFREISKTINVNRRKLAKICNN